MKYILSIAERLPVLFFWTAVAAIFLGLPLALLPGGITSMRYDVAVPWEAMLALLALPVLIAGGRAFPGRLAVVTTAAFMVSLIVNWLYFHSAAEPGLRLAAMMLVPLAMAISLRSDRMQRLLPLPLTIAWFCQIVLRLVPPGTKGFAGNANWQTALLLALTPWVILHFWQQLPQRFRWPAVVAVSTVSVWMILPYSSRAGWLAVAAVGLFWISMQLRPMLRTVPVLLAVLALVVSLKNQPEKWQRGFSKDVRLPFLQASAALLRDHDRIFKLAAGWIPGIPHREGLIAELQPSGPRGYIGVGPGNFRRAFTPYRAITAYGATPVAAHISIHPHNEFLHIAAQIGIVAAVVWLLFVLRPLPFGYRRGATGFQRAAVCSVTVLLVQGLVDMPLWRPPTTVLFLIALGAAWTAWSQAPRDSSEDADGDRSALKCRRRQVAVCLFPVSAVLAIVVAVPYTLAEYQFRQAAKLEDQPGRTGDALNAYEASARYADQPATALMFAGRVALNQAADPVSARSYFDAAYRLDPNIGHINRDLGRTLGALGAHEDAFNCFGREQLLFPYDPAPYGYLLHSAFFNGRYDLMQTLADSGAQIGADQCRRRLGADTAEKLAATWTEAMQQQNLQAAVAAANELCAPAGEWYIDPLLTVTMTSADDYSAEDIQPRFTLTDARYWQDLRYLREIAATVGGRNATPETIAAWLKANLQSQPGMPDCLRFADANGQANPLDSCRIAIGIAWQCKIPAFVIASDPRPAVLLRYLGQSVALDPAAQWQTRPSLSAADSRILLPRPAYLLRNHLLAAALDTGATHRMAVPPIPSHLVAELSVFRQPLPPLRELVQPPMKRSPL